MNVVVAGLGSIGRRHARNLLRLGVRDIIGMDPSEERRAQFNKELSLPSVETLDELSGQIFNLAVIASPNRFHIEQSLHFAKQGAHLFIEKPLGTNLENVAALEQIVGSQSLFAHVGSNWKFHPSFRAMKSLLDEGAIGRVIGGQVLAGQWLPDWHPWEDYRQMYSSKKELGGGGCA